MGQFSNALLAINKAHTLPQGALDYRLGLGGLNKIDGRNSFEKHCCKICCTVQSNYHGLGREKLRRMI